MTNIDKIRDINYRIIECNEILEYLNLAANNKKFDPFECNKYKWLKTYERFKTVLENLKKSYNEIYEKLTDEEKLIIEIGE